RERCGSTAASTGRTRDRTRPMLQKSEKVLARAPSTRDPKTWRSSREVQKSTFARFSGLFDFRLLQQNRHQADIGPVMFEVRYRGDCVAKVFLSHRSQIFRAGNRRSM